MAAERMVASGFALSCPADMREEWWEEREEERRGGDEEIARRRGGRKWQKDWIELGGNEDGKREQEGRSRRSKENQEEEEEEEEEKLRGVATDRSGNVRSGSVDGLENPGTCSS
eukprot:761782-Hanusia_phi.AAC.3